MKEGKRRKKEGKRREKGGKKLKSSQKGVVLRERRGIIGVGRRRKVKICSLEDSSHLGAKNTGIPIQFFINAPRLLLLVFHRIIDQNV